MGPNFQGKRQLDPVAKLTATPPPSMSSTVAAVRGGFGSADSAAAAHTLKTC